LDGKFEPKWAIEDNPTENYWKHIMKNLDCEVFLKVMKFNTDVGNNFITEYVRNCQIEVLKYTSQGIKFWSLRLYKIITLEEYTSHNRN
jgi:nucleoside permease NupC